MGFLGRQKACSGAQKTGRSVNVRVVYDVNKNGSLLSCPPKMNTNTIVVIDDDLDDLDIMADVIATVDPSAHCMTFKDPVIAVNELLSSESPTPKYIFIDHNMPTMRGDEVLRKLRQADRFNESIIILISTSMPALDSSKFFEAGAQYAVEKPNRLANYYTLLKSIFRNHR